MSIIDILFGVLILGLGLSLVFRPSWILGVMESGREETWLYAAAVVARLVLGIALIQAAAISKFPMVILVLGWIALIAAAVLLVIGKSRFTRLVGWAVPLLKPWGRIGGVAGAAFGAFLIYAFV